ncbi:UNVERIFIED_CONTAM: hypothetical protein K2H54_038159 [Gekko kuhli]
MNGGGIDDAEGGRKQDGDKERREEMAEEELLDWLWEAPEGGSLQQTRMATGAQLAANPEGHDKKAIA